MTTEAFFSGVNSGDDTGSTAPDREELLRRDRQRRLALLEQKKHRQQAEALPAEPPAPQRLETGQSVAPAFQEPSSRLQSNERCQQALDAAHVVADATRAAGHPATQLEVSMRSMTAEELASAVVRAVLPLPPVQAVSLLWRSHRAGLAVLPERQAARAEALLNRNPGTLTGEDDDEDPDVTAAWQLFVDHERSRYLRLDQERQRRLLIHLPLPVVDDLIDAKRVSPQAVPDDGERHLYLLARIAPLQVRREELMVLGWHEELTRREFKARLARGDVAALQDLDALHGEQHRLATALQDVRRTGKIPPELAEQRWLWPALERLAPNAAVNFREHKPYAQWLLVRRILRAIRQAHQARLRGDDQKYHVMLQTAEEYATPLQDSRAIAGWEARNALAYLKVLRSGHSPQYDNALNILSPPPGRALSHAALPQKAQLPLTANRKILDTLKEQHKNVHILNPFAVLGVPDKFPGWKERWRELRRSLDADGEAQVNEAKDAIQAWERGRAPVALFALPLMPEKWANPRSDDRTTGQDARPMPRKTSPPTADEREFARRRATQGVIRAACSHVGLPMTYPILPKGHQQ